jgi:formylglycine-generating enzyme required for sulfatase activity
MRDLVAGAYRVEAWRDGWRRGFGSVVIRDGEVSTWVLGESRRPRGEQSGEATIGKTGGTARLQVRTVPADCEVEIPALGMVAENKDKALWEAEGLPAGEVEVLLRRGEATMSRWVKLADDSTTMVTVDFLLGTANVAQSSSLVAVSSFVEVRPGAYMAGSARGEAHEAPLQVAAGRTFWLGAREVTVADWRRVMGTDDVWGNDRSLVPQEPIAVPLAAAEAYVERLNALSDGSTYRLPTEAEWEYVAQRGVAAGAATASVRCAETCLFGYEGARSWERPIYRLYPAGSGTADAYGLFDVLGNRWEWCSGRWASNEVGALGGDGGSGAWAVVRGGAYDVPRASCTSWGRKVVKIDDRAGFRLVADRQPEAGR